MCRITAAPGQKWSCGFLNKWINLKWYLSQCLINISLKTHNNKNSLHPWKLEQWACFQIPGESSFNVPYVYIQYFGHLIWRADSLEKTDAEKDWMQEEMGMTEDEMVGWHHWYNGHEFEQTLGDGEGKGSLACSSPWGHKELDTT